MSTYTLPQAGSHFISLATAIEMTAQYRQLKEQVLQPEYRHTGLLCTSETFVLQDVLTLLKEPGCAGLRIYYGMKGDHQVHAILVGVNAMGQDLLPSNTGLLTDSLILQEGQRCPPLCGEPSPLNP